MEQEQTVCTSRTLIFLDMQNQLYGNTYTVFNEFCYFVFLLQILKFYWNQWIFNVLQLLQRNATSRVFNLIFVIIFKTNKQKTQTVFCPTHCSFVALIPCWIPPLSLCDSGRKSYIGQSENALHVMLIPSCLCLASLDLIMQCLITGTRCLIKRKI